MIGTPAAAFAAAGGRLSVELLSVLVEAWLFSNLETTFWMDSGRAGFVEASSRSCFKLPFSRPDLTSEAPPISLPLIKT
jgi:hypothetical protein